MGGDVGSDGGVGKFVRSREITSSETSQAWKIFSDWCGNNHLLRISEANSCVSLQFI